MKLQGKLAKSLGKGQEFEFQAKDVTIIGDCDPEVRDSNRWMI